MIRDEAEKVAAIISEIIRSTVKKGPDDALRSAYAALKVHLPDIRWVLKRSRLDGGPFIIAAERKRMVGGRKFYLVCNSDQWEITDTDGVDLKIDERIDQKAWRKFKREGRPGDVMAFSEGVIVRVNSIKPQVISSKVKK